MTFSLKRSSLRGYISLLLERQFALSEEYHPPIYHTLLPTAYNRWQLPRKHGVTLKRGKSNSDRSISQTERSSDKEPSSQIHFIYICLKDQHKTSYFSHQFPFKTRVTYYCTSCGLCLFVHLFRPILKTSWTMHLQISKGLQIFQFLYKFYSVSVRPVRSCLFCLLLVL